MSATQRAQQISAHLNYPKGMLAGQVAIITGSGQGIGAEAARLFANEGAKVVVSDIDASMRYTCEASVYPLNRCRTEKADQVAADINASGGSAISIPGDMLDDKYVNELPKKAADFGGGKLHIIVNNAGFTWDGVVHKVHHSPSQMQELYD